MEEKKLFLAIQPVITELLLPTILSPTKCSICLIWLLSWHHTFSSFMMHVTLVASKSPILQMSIQWTWHLKPSHLIIWTCGTCSWRVLLELLTSHNLFSTSATILESSGPDIIHLLKAAGFSVGPTALSSPLLLLFTCSWIDPLPDRKTVSSLIIWNAKFPF